MKTILWVLIFVLLLGGIVWVNPYRRKDGTYVPGHYRTAPNSTELDNWSTSPNTNPFTGKQGTERPYRSKIFDTTY